MGTAGGVSATGGAVTTAGGSAASLTQADSNPSGIIARCQRFSSVPSTTVPPDSTKQPPSGTCASASHCTGVSAKFSRSAALTAAWSAGFKRTVAGRPSAINMSSASVTTGCKTVVLVRSSWRTTWRAKSLASCKTSCAMCWRIPSRLALKVCTTASKRCAISWPLWAM